MDCEQITKIITDIEGFQKTLDLAIKKELPINDGLDAKKNIEIYVLEVDEATRMRFAEKLFGQDFLGPEQIKEAFLSQVEIPEIIPLIPFSKDELERAQKLGQILILRVNETRDGSPLTMEKIYDLMNNEIKDKVKVLSHIDWYKDEDFYKREKPEVSWALVTKEIIPNSGHKNYLEQTEALIDYVSNEVYKGKIMPPMITEAIKEFEQEKTSLAQIIDSQKKSEWQEAAKRLADQRINKLFRQSPVESLYDLIVYYQQTGTRLMKNIYTWTNGRHSDGSLVCVGYFRSGGVDVNGYLPVNARDDLGVSFSCTC